MTQMKLKNPADLEKWLYQNKAEIADCFDGCLLDNYLAETPRGYAAIYETYRNPNASDYTIFFAPYAETENGNRIINDFYKRLNDYEKEYNTED